MDNLFVKLGLSYVQYHQFKNLLIFLFGIGAMWFYMRAREVFRYYKFVFDDLGAGYQMMQQLLKNKEGREELITILNSRKHAYLPVYFRLMLHHMKNGDPKLEKFFVEYNKKLQLEHYLYLILGSAIVVFTLYLIFFIQN